MITLLPATRRTVVGVVLCLSLFFAPSGFADVFVIANPSVVGLAATDVRDVYLGEKRFAGSVGLKPVDNATQQSHFLSAVVKMDVDKYNNWWIKKAFRDGLVQPEMKSSDLEIIEYVKVTPGAVGYIGSPPPAGVASIGKY